MDRYKDYMDAVEVSDTLHEKLKRLEPPRKRRPAWKEYGGLAAALVLMAGVGAVAWGFGGDVSGWPSPAVDIGVADVGREDFPAPFPNPVGPNDPNAPADRTNGGYEVQNGEMAQYYFLPALEWADASVRPQNSMDYQLAPPDAHSRDMTRDDVLLFTGGEKAMADHLLWDGLDWDGTIWFADEFTPCAAFLYAEGNDLSLSLEVMLGGEVPSCIVLPEEYYETSRWQGTKITAVKNGGYAVIDGVELKEKREISLLYANHVGYKLTLYAADAARAGELCARFVRYAVDGGFSLSVLPFRAGDLPNKGRPPEDAPGADIVETAPPYSAPSHGDGAPRTTPYDPNVMAEAKAPTPPN